MKYLCHTLNKLGRSSLLSSIISAELQIVEFFKHTQGKETGKNKICCGRLFHLYQLQQTRGLFLFIIIWTYCVGFYFHLFTESVAQINLKFIYLNFFAIMHSLSTFDTTVKVLPRISTKYINIFIWTQNGRSSSRIVLHSVVILLWVLFHNLFSNCHIQFNAPRNNCRLSPNKEAHNKGKKEAPN